MVSIRRATVTYSCFTFALCVQKISTAFAYNFLLQTQVDDMQNMQDANLHCLPENYRFR